MDESIVKHLDAPPKVLKLSAAIRLGAKIRPQCFGTLFSFGGGSCAMGAAAEALGRQEDLQGASLEKWEEVFGLPRLILLKAVEWNDADHMSREAIADRLEAMGY